MDEWLEVGRVMLAAVLALAGATKLRNRHDFEAVLRLLPLPSSRLHGALSLFIPGAELIGAALLVFAPLIGAVSALVLVGLFSAVALHAMVTGNKVPCACFGSSNGSLGLSTIVRNIPLLVAATALVASEPLPSGVTSLPAALIGALMAATILLLDFSVPLAQDLRALARSNSS